MPQRKRKDNPGKLDKRNPPLKTRLPVTGHPATITTPQASQPPQISPPLHLPPATVADCEDYESNTESDEEPEPTPFGEIALGFRVHAKGKAKETCAKAAWCLRELMMFFDADIQVLFSTPAFRESSQDFDLALNQEGSAWVLNTPPIRPPPPPPTPCIHQYGPASNTHVCRGSNDHHLTSPRQPPKDKGKAPSKATPPPTTIPPRTNREKIAPPPESQKGKAPPETRGKGKGRLSPPPTLAKTMVLHAAPTKFKPGQMRRWIEEDNKSTGVQILGIRWLMQEHRRAGKMASSLVIYMKERINIDQGLRMGRRFFRTTCLSAATYATSDPTSLLSAAASVNDHLEGQDPVDNPPPTVVPVGQLSEVLTDVLPYVAVLGLSR
ncbi:hypothetical protein BGX38DRAFT_1270643 [Terfezia claveryi]|nr:hypothetical protein BGX38DRAFT_1270643 [Terfezia claveryi]